MTQPFIGEIRIFPYDFAVRNWAECNGQLLAIQQNQALFSLLGTTYGGNGVTTFALPNLRGREAIHQGTGGGDTYTIGEAAGVESVTVLTGSMPAHTHRAGATTQTGDDRNPIGTIWAAASVNRYGAGLSDLSLAPAAIGNAGGNQAHQNIPPYLALNFQIALFGIFPSRN